MLLRSGASTVGALAAPADRPPSDDLRRYGEFLAAEGFSDYFVAPLRGAASCPASGPPAPGTALQYPARYLFRVPGQPRDARGHRLAAVAHRHRRLAHLRRADRRAAAPRCDARTRSRGAPGTPTASSVPRRRRRGHRLRRASSSPPTPTRRWRLLADPTDDEARLLGAFGYSRNETCCTPTRSLLPAAARARASWNYRMALLRRRARPHGPVTY